MLSLVEGRIMLLSSDGRKTILEYESQESLIQEQREFVETDNG